MVEAETPQTNTDAPKERPQKQKQRKEPTDAEVADPSEAATTGQSSRQNRGRRQPNRQEDSKKVY